MKVWTILKICRNSADNVIAIKIGLVTDTIRKKINWGVRNAHTWLIPAPSNIILPTKENLKVCKTN